MCISRVGCVLLMAMMLAVSVWAAGSSPSGGPDTTLTEPSDIGPSEGPAAVAGGVERIDGGTPRERMAAFLNYCAASFDPGSGDEARRALVSYAAKIYTGKDATPAMARWQKTATRVFEQARKRLSVNSNDGNARNPFEKHALIHGYMICRDKAKFSPDVIDVMKKYVALYRHKEWIGYGALNYRVMNDGSGFIAAEQWPDLVDADGLDSKGIAAATKARLMGYFDDIVHNNTDEYGAPTYLGIDLSAIKLLADFAQDPEVKHHAAMALDSMLLQVACAWNQGYYTTPASRCKYFSTNMSSPDALDTTGAIGWLYFGARRPIAAPHTNPPGSFWFAVPGDYQPPAIFADVANDRATPFVHQGSVRRNIRFMIYHTSTYSLTSEWELLSSPSDGHYKESRRQMLKWLSPSPDSTFFPFQENPRRPYRLQEHVANAFGYGENPFAQSLQDAGTLIGISSVPADYPYWKMLTPFTTAGAIIERFEKDGWVFCHGGSMLFAFRYAQSSQWAKHRPKENCDVLESDSRNNGWVLETSQLQPFAGGGVHAELARFAETIAAKTGLDVSAIDADHPKLVYHSLMGHKLELTFRSHKEPYTNQQIVDGKPVDYAAYPLFGNPWVHQALGGDVLTIHHGSQILTYDFKTWQMLPVGSVN